MKKIALLILISLLTDFAQAGTWLPTGTLANNCAIFTITGTTSGDVIIADYNSTLQKKPAGSNIWTPSGLSGRKVRYLTTLPNGDIYAISGTGSYIASSVTMIHRSTDNGATWQTLFSRGFAYNNMVGGAIAVLQDNSLLAAFPVQKGPTIGDIVWTLVYKSTDNGNTWFAKDSNQIGEPKGMVTTGDNKIILGSTEDGAYYSTQGGSHWWPVDTTSHFFGTRYTMDIVKSREGTIFYTEGSKVRRSTNGGLTTQVLTTPSPTVAINAICVESDNELYIATDDKKVYKSIDMGNTWQLMTSGLPAAANVYSLKVIDGKLFAGTYAYGVYYYEPDVVGVQNNIGTVKGFELRQNYPNPFNPSTNISFTIPKSSFVTLTVCDMLGKEVAVLLNENKPEGNYNISFDASKLAGGAYFYKLSTNEFSDIKKMVIIK